jgi:hypothetical protein
MRNQIINRAWAVANQVAAGSQGAIRLTKRALNNWLCVAGPIFVPVPIGKVAIRSGTSVP